MIVTSSSKSPSDASNLSCLRFRPPSGQENSLQSFPFQDMNLNSSSFEKGWKFTQVDQLPLDSQPSPTQTNAICQAFPVHSNGSVCPFVHQEWCNFSKALCGKITFRCPLGARFRSQLTAVYPRSGDRQLIISGGFRQWSWNYDRADDDVPWRPVLIVDTLLGCLLSRAFHGDLFVSAGVCKILSIWLILFQY